MERDTFLKRDKISSDDGGIVERRMGRICGAIEGEGWGPGAVKEVWCRFHRLGLGLASCVDCGLLGGLDRRKDGERSYK